VLAFAVLGLLLVGAVLFGAYRLLTHRGGADGDGSVIAAPAGDYKVRPDDPGGLKLGGEGEAAVATSTGTAGADGGRIDTGAVPERPVQVAQAAPAPTPAPAAQGAQVVSAVPASGGRLTAAPPAAAPRARVPGAGSGGVLVQLGAYPSAAIADREWSDRARRFGYLASLTKVVQVAQVGGHTVYRLRVDAGSAGAAADLCGRLKVAGEGCFVTTS
jgi:hypothetical protein